MSNTKTILGLDLGTNSIGWALVKQDFDNKQGEILGMGSRIIPTDPETLGRFENGNPLSKANAGRAFTPSGKRTDYRSARKLNERHLQRRERLHRVLNILGFLPEHYKNEIHFTEEVVNVKTIKKYGKFRADKEPKLVWKPNGKRENGKEKFEFLFQDLFKEMVEEFKKNQPQLFYAKENGEITKIPYDWTIYYLRKKALSQKVSKEELAWLILNFNQKRGYYQLRGEEEENNKNVKEFVTNLIISNVEKGEVDKKNEKRNLYKITFSNGWEYNATFITEPNWKDTEKEFLVTEEYDDNRIIKIVKDKKSDTIGKEKRRITPLPTFEEIDLMSKKDQDKIYGKIKARTELTIRNSHSTVGSYIFNCLLQNPKQKINGKLVRTIERKLYKEELKLILEKQIELQPELFTEDLYFNCIRELYRSNEAHQQLLNSKNDFTHLILDDIIFYQRPLKSQKSSIGNCSLEFREYRKKVKDGKEIEVKEYLKCIPKSNPYFQEFRVWQWLNNLKIYSKTDDKDVTEQFIKSNEDKEQLFEFLMSKIEVDHKEIMKHLLKDLKGKAQTSEIAKYRWNYVYDSEKDESKKYPMNVTGSEIRKQLKKVSNVPYDFLSITDTREIINKKGQKIVVSLDTREYQLWHIIYSVTDKKEFEGALTNFARKHNIDTTSFVENFRKLIWKEKDYGSLSEKAIKRLLPLMRLGKYWSFDVIDEKTKQRISNLQTGEVDDIIKDRVREKAIHLTENIHFQGLPLWLASYIVYDKHSEGSGMNQFMRSHDLQKYLYEFKQHSLRNPIVEQVVIETLSVVKDIWEYYAKKNNVKCEMVYDERKKRIVESYPRFFDKIHIELSRELKHTADERSRITKQVSNNENTNLRIKSLLMEFANDNYFVNQQDYNNEDGETFDYNKKGINPIRPYSPTQHDIFKIYEDGVLNSGVEIPDFVNETLKKFNETDEKKQPTKSEINRYKLWLEQKYKSPYTGRIIPLSKLFTPEYEIEHIIPKSRYFDDSFNNKVICESAVNRLKGNQLGMEFIKNHYGEKVQTISGEVQVLTEDQYKKFLEDHYTKNLKKKSNLMLDEIPDKMISRQMNDTRYISKFVMRVLSDIVRIDSIQAGKIIEAAYSLANKETDKIKAEEIIEQAKKEANDDGINSKNVISSNGKITSILKQDWGLNNVWNKVILPRFERLNDVMKTEVFTTLNKEGHPIPAIPFNNSQGFQKKRIDHRHHALDALIIACATRDHVNLLNNQSAKSEITRIDLQNKLRKKESWKDKEGEVREKYTEFKKPWESFRDDAKSELEKIIISVKQNLRVINKATNHYEKFENGKKIKVKQEGINWAIRKPLHEETVSGKVNLSWVELKENEIITATRKSLDSTFDKEKIGKITDKGIQKILNNYFDFTIDNTENLKAFKEQILLESSDKKKKELEKKLNKETAEIAFSPEGIDKLNKNIKQHNNGKHHQPIYKVRIYEKGKGRFALGQTGNKKDKFVQGAPNLFFAIYQDENGKRSFETIPLNIVIEREKKGLSSVPEKNDNGYGLCPECPFLSPNDLIYVPSKAEQENINSIDFNNLTEEQISRIFFVNDFSGITCYFRPNRIAKAIIPKEVDMSYDEKKQKITGSFDFKTASFDGKPIKDICIKLHVNRLGKISINKNH